MTVADRLSSALADRYRLERELGQGGMATVYLAEDLKHKRRVAVKVLKPELAAVLGAERFVQEITTTAALQHPHILPLFDSGEANGFLYYVMPFIDGETLRAKLDRETQLGVEESVRIASDVASALHYAHTHGVIHRDIKPENILLHDGRPMVADFGIALAVSAAAGGRMTETGLSLGTPHYMSPEQATAEKEISARSDVYSLGSVLYEMLTGEPPHMGTSAQQIIMKIITEDATPVTRLRKSVPANVAAAVAMSLEKLPADRFSSAAEFAQALANPGFTTSVASAGVGRGATAPWQVNRLAMALGGVMILAVGVATWALTRPAPVQPVSRFNIRMSVEELIAGPSARIVLTPDGSRLIYTAAPGDSRMLGLRVRAQDQLHSTALTGTDDARAPFVSPDGQKVGFASNGALYSASLSGGPPVVITDTLVGNAGATWSPNGFIYSDGLGTAGLVRIPATGGQLPAPFTQLDSAYGEIDHIFPEALPNGKGVLFIVTSNGDGEIAVANTATGEHRRLLRGAYVRYAKSGHLVYVTADGSLMAVPFDQDAMVVTGEPVALANGIPLRDLGAPDLTIADNGTLMYTIGGVAPGGGEPVWVSRDGRTELVAPDWTRKAGSVALSPDGRQMAASIGDDNGSNIWVRRFGQGVAPSRITFQGSINWRPSWTPDGQTLTYISNRTGARAMHSQRADGTSEATLVFQRPTTIQEALVTSDGSWVVYRAGAGSSANLFARRTSGDTTSIVLADSKFPEAAPTVSPNGQLLAYASTETGRHEVYVRSFPDVLGGKWLVSTEGGAEPLWSRDGKELFYRNGNGDMVAVAVADVGGTPVGAERVLFPTSGYVKDLQHRMYDVTPDGKRFLMLRLDNDEVGDDTELIVVKNFFEELKRLVPRR